MFSGQCLSTIRGICYESLCVIGLKCEPLMINGCDAFLCLENLEIGFYVFWGNACEASYVLLVLMLSFMGLFQVR